MHSFPSTSSPLKHSLLLLVTPIVNIAKCYSDAISSCIIIQNSLPVLVFELHTTHEIVLSEFHLILPISELSIIESELCILREITSGSQDQKEDEK